MSRSLGDLLFTTWPPMSSSPEVMSSRPAIMLSVVDFPQPDGPTRMTNSPSAMSRLKSLTASDPSGKALGDVVKHDFGHLSLLNSASP